MSAADSTTGRVTSVFLSHNRADKSLARSLGTQLKLAGADVWFDEWEIRAGDSIPGKLNEGLSAFGTFVLMWSVDAARSNWVRREVAAAITRGMEDASLRVIPIRLDDTELPPLLADLRYLRAEDPNVRELAVEILGLSSEREWLKAVQKTLDEAGIAVGFFPGYGAIVCCPRCGADDQYAGARCRDCHWEGGGEV